MALTILDSIKAAELKADDIKAQTLAKAKDYLRDSEEQTTYLAEQIITKARAAAREKVAEAEKQAQKSLQELLAENNAQNALLAEKAAKKVDEVSKYIIAKVVD